MFDYNLKNIPKDFMKFVTNSLTLDIMALLLCATVYWGGTLAWVYMVIFSLGWQTSAYVWLGMMILNALAAGPMLRGLYYADKGSGNTQTLMAITGPPGTFRTMALILFCLLRIGDLRLLQTPVQRWGEEYTKGWASPWLNLFEEEAENYVEKSFETRIREAWKFCNKRIEII